MSAHVCCSLSPEGSMKWLLIGEFPSSQLVNPCILVSSPNTHNHSALLKDLHPCLGSMRTALIVNQPEDDCLSRILACLDKSSLPIDCRCVDTECGFTGLLMRTVSVTDPWSD